MEDVAATARKKRLIAPGPFGELSGAEEEDESLHGHAIGSVSVGPLHVNKDVGQEAAAAVQKK